MKIRGAPKPVLSGIEAGHVHPPPPALSARDERVTDKYAALGPFPPPPPGGRTNVLRGVEVTAYTPSDLAEAEAARVVSLMTARPDIQKKLKQARVELVIIPKNVRMTDLEEFGSLKGLKTFDGREWDDVRGIGGTHTPDGRTAVGIPEENLANLPGDTYPGNYSVAMHELAHCIHGLLNLPERTSIDQAYEARKAAGGPWTEQYGSSNVHEYFAQATNAFFGRNQGMGHNGKAWLEKNDPQILAVLTKIYGAT